MSNDDFQEYIPEDQPRIPGVLYLRNRAGELGRFNVHVEEFDELIDGTWVFLIQTVEHNIKTVRTAGRR